MRDRVLKFLIPIILGTFAIVIGSYVVRWLFTILTAFVLFVYSIEGWEPKIRIRMKREFGDNEVQRLSKIILRSKFSDVSKEIIKDHILEAYHMLGYEYRVLRENPPEGVRLLVSEGDFVENLKKSLDKLEEEIG
ncbi:hypothetical protein [Pyrococcus sp. ST04]|uniref:hypothetical protein n=1 Tax=Pyrococcus sp. ST04 TaxID=1183377 RepID=UPI0002605BC1|nr:hypothetical protein [Pyrococcus sp. ST04]AFK22300.1 hypothetical protein Py04_0698 [Pyrococcus sp. ST04]